MDNTITVNVGGYEYTADIKAGEMKEFAFDIPANAEYVNKNISITLGMNGTTWLDNVSLVENALIKNGSFNAGTTGYTVYVDSSAKASYVVDSLKDDNALAVTIDDTGDQDWKVQIKQENIMLEKGKTYKKGEADNRTGLSEKAAGYMDAFKAALENDLLIPVAMSQVNKVLKDSALDAREALELIDRMDSVLGLKLIETAGTAQKEAQKNAEPAVISHEGDPEAAEIDALVAERTEAKKNKDFAKADEIAKSIY